MYKNCYIDESSKIDNSVSVGSHSVISENCRIEKGTNIGCHVVIEDGVFIGSDCNIGDMVSICANVEIGENSFIETGAVIVRKIEQRAKHLITPPTTVIGKNVIIHSKAVIEAGCKVPDNTIIDYGEIINNR